MRFQPRGSAPSAQPDPLSSQNVNCDHPAGAMRRRSAGGLRGWKLQRRSRGRDGNINRIKECACLRRPKPFFLQVMLPRVNLLSPNLMALRHLRHARPINTNRHDNLKLVVIMPKASPLSPKNFAAHRTPRIRHVANDVIKHVS